MNTHDPYFYPSTPGVLHDYAESIFAPIRRGESVTAVWVPMAGRRVWNKFIIENISLFEKELPHYENYLLVYVEPLDLTEDTLEGYVRLLAKSFIEVACKNKSIKEKVEKMELSIFDQQNVSYSQILESFRTLLKNSTDSGLEIIFFLGEFDELSFSSKVFYNNLKSVWNKLYPRLHYVFLMRTHVSDPNQIPQWGELTEVLLPNLVYAPLPEQESIDYLINYFSSIYALKLNEEEKSVLVKWCGGHPYMLKVACRFLSQNKPNDCSIDEFERLLQKDHVLTSIASSIFNLRTQSEKNILISIAKDKEVTGADSDTLNFLLNLGYIKKNNGTYTIFSKFFESAILDVQKTEVMSLVQDNEIHLNPEESAIVFRGAAIDEKFTHQEHVVLTECLKRSGQIVTREDIGNVLWGKDSYERYSDWAIDQLMSKLRKKLEKMGSKTTIRTLRGRGYKLVTL